MLRKKKRKPADPLTSYLTEKAQISHLFPSLKSGL